MARNFTRYTHIVLLLAVTFLMPLSSANSNDIHSSSEIHRDASDYFPQDFVPQDDAKKGTSCMDSCEADGEDVDECRESCIQTVKLGDGSIPLACR